MTNADRIRFMDNPRVAEAHARFEKVRDMLRADASAEQIRVAVGLANLPATYNLIARTRRHFGAGLGDNDLRPAGSAHSPKQYVRRGQVAAE
jgi:hypothetical protein